LLPAFVGKSLERNALYWEHEGSRAVRMGDRKLVAKGAGEKWELYDLTADRTETTDLAGREPARVKELGEKWEAWAARCRVLPWPWQPPYERK
jgi:arylsulfatase